MQSVADCSRGSLNCSLASLHSFTEARWDDTQGFVLILDALITVILHRAASALRVNRRTLPRRAAPQHYTIVQRIVEYPRAALAVTMDGRRHPTLTTCRVQPI